MKYSQKSQRSKAPNSYNILRQMLGQFQRYDTNEYPFPEYFSNQINNYLNQYGNKILQLEDLHKLITSLNLKQIYDYIYRAEETQEFLNLYHRFLQSVIFKSSGLVDLVFQTRPSIRIHLPGLSPTIFHTDKQFSHGENTITCWVPLTKLYKTNTLQLINPIDSERLLTELKLEKLSMEQFSKNLLRISAPILSTPGHVFFFGSNWAHGTRINRTDSTRVSFDFRISYRNTSLGTKGQGGYYANAESLKQNENIGLFEANKVFISPLAVTYVYSNYYWTKYITTSHQRLICKEMARRLDVNIIAEYNEFAQVPFSPVLLELCRGKAANSIKNIILFSVVCLPKSNLHRQRIYDAAQVAKINLWFANEQLIFPLQVNVAEIEATWQHLTNSASHTKEES